MTIKNKRKKRIYMIDVKSIPEGHSLNQFIKEWKQGMYRGIANSYYYDNKK